MKAMLFFAKIMASFLLVIEGFGRMPKDNYQLYFGLAIVLFLMKIETNENPSK